MGSIYAAGTAISGCLLFTMGMAIDRFGARSMTLWVILPGLICACLVSSYMTSYWQVLLSIFLLRYLGQGAMGSVPNVVMAHWFVKQRGRALSFMGVGGFLSAMILPPMNTLLIDSVGWRQAWIVWAVLVAVCMYPLTFCFYRSKPIDIGLTGEPAIATEDQADDEY